MTVTVNDRVRVEPGRDGTLVVMGAWCGRCGREVLPVGAGDCPWCGSHILDEAQLSARAMLQQLRNGHAPAALEEAETDGAKGETSASSSPGSLGPPVKWTRERCIAAIREVGEKVGRTPSRTEMKAAGYVSVTVSSTTLARLEMTWEDLLREAGFDPEDTRRAAALAPTSPEGNTAARPAESEREPEAIDPAEAVVAPSRRALLAAEGATSRSEHPLLADMRRYLLLRRELGRQEDRLLAAIERELAA